MINFRTLYGLFFTLCILLLAPAANLRAQTAQTSKNAQPLEITADGTLEWNRAEKLFIAKKNAMAIQGPTSIKAETLSAYYRETERTNMDIRQVLAEGSVVIRSQENTAYGDKADYDLDKGLAVMTGDQLKMTGPGQVVTARDRFEYHVTEGRLIAEGQAKVVRTDAQGQSDTLEADTVTAKFKGDKTGQRALETLEAKGHVVITTPTEIVTGAYGIYSADTNIARLTGGVSIRRGPNILEGDEAQVDLNTNTSRIFASQTGGERVRGIFYPGSEKQ
jgi:lipopolysaccharide export system protein LptA